MSRLLVVLLALLAACAVGPRAENQPLAHEPRGATVVLRTPTQSISGELLAVRETGYVVLRERQRIAVVPFTVIQESEFELIGRFTERGRVPPRERIERLRRVSRYPQGIDTELERALLAAYGQPAVEVLSR